MSTSIPAKSPLEAQRLLMSLRYSLSLSDDERAWEHRKILEGRLREIGLPDWCPQEGPQTAFFDCTADICVYGGAAGGGKSTALLMEPLKHVHNPDFGAVIFRRTYAQITKQGALWDESRKIYPLHDPDASENQTGHTWTFPSGAKIGFAHFQHESDLDDWRGAQIPLIEIDQVEQFTEGQFWGLVERNRSTCGVRPYMRCSCNPLPGTWLSELLAWWIDQDTGYAIEERSGVVRWFVRVDEELHWADTEEDLKRAHPDVPAKSFTFILSKLDDNQILLRSNPQYRANLMALPRVQRLRQYGGNWLVNDEDGLIDTSGFKIVGASPRLAARVRYWDKAGTPGDGAFSCGVLIAKSADGLYYVEDVVRGQWSALQREQKILQTAELDRARGRVVIWTEQEPGSGGKESAEATVRNLAGFEIHAERVTGDKVTRAMPYATQVEAGNVYIVRGEWNKAFIDENAAFPGGTFKDQVDAAAGAFNKVAPMNAEAGKINVGPRSTVLNEMPQSF